MKNKNFTFQLLIIFIVCCSQSCSKKSSSTDQPNPSPVYPPVSYDWQFESTPVWTEDFSVDGPPDASKWSYDVGGNGWGNNELQYYSNGLNATVSGGILKITAKKEGLGGNNYSSARMVTKNKADWLYGRFEIKAKLPKGRGTWPAIWMLPTDNEYGNWPNSGEIDIMEHVGFDPNNIHFTLHAKNFYGANGKGGSKYVPGVMDDFHIYRLDWASYGIRGYVDGEKIFEYFNPRGAYGDWPFDKKFHMLLNIAIGGNWGGAQGVDNSIFPTTMDVDYINVYKFVK